MPNFIAGICQVRSISFGILAKYAYYHSAYSPSTPDSNQTSKNSHHFEGTPIENFKLGIKMHTNRVKKTGEVFVDL